MRQKPAFTLVELLVVIAVIAILAAILFPVFARVGDKTRQAVCASNFKQQALSLQMYATDNDDMMVPSYYGDGSAVSLPCKVYGQILQPYIKNIQIYRCPSDLANEDQRTTIGLPLPQGSQDQRDYDLAMKNDFGFNFQYLSPIFYYYPNPATADTVVYSVPARWATLGAPADTLLAVDSVWDRDQNGIPFGGGRGGADPPCISYSDGTSSLVVNGSIVPGSGRYSYGGWQPSSPQAGNRYGHAWHWHGERATVVFCDGHTKALTMDRLADGCDVQEYSSGTITNRGEYLWDLK